MIPYNLPFMTGKELDYIRQAIEVGHLSGDGAFTKRVHAWLCERLGVQAALMTHSCTAALEMIGLLLELEPGDEVIMPSFTFVSTANAVVLRGATPVFVDIRPDTLNIDETLVESAITERTRAIVAVHYAGVACEMDALAAVARRHGLALVEDAAQGVGSTYKGHALGSIGILGAISFHETKNLISGEGGALLINDPALTERAEILREKGTNRSRFFRGEIDKYTWVDIGSSFLPSEMIAAFLWAQLEVADGLLADRLESWKTYRERLRPLEESGFLRGPVVPDYAQHNGHIYYVLVPNASMRGAVLDALRERGVGAVFHYVPLHSSPAGRRFGRAGTDLTNTETLSARLIRLPLYPRIGEDVLDRVCSAIEDIAHSSVP